MKNLTPVMAHPLVRARFLSLRQDREVRAAMDRNEKRILAHRELENPAGYGGMAVVAVIVLAFVLYAAVAIGFSSH